MRGTLLLAAYKHCSTVFHESQEVALRQFGKLGLFLPGALAGRAEIRFCRAGMLSAACYPYLTQALQLCLLQSGVSVAKPIVFGPRER